MQKTDIAISFLNLAASGKVREAYESHVHPDFRHHNPFFKGDRESLLRAMEEAAVTNPNRFLEVQHVFHEGDMVAVHSRVQLLNGSDIAVVHILRFHDDKIIELWDIGQAAPKDSPNQNGMF
jgi:predicted SnoaL-like aldol condensation-catalyzing enzyme